MLLLQELCAKEFQLGALLNAVRGADKVLAAGFAFLYPKVGFYGGADLQGYVVHGTGGGFMRAVPLAVAVKKAFPSGEVAVGVPGGRGRIALRLRGAECRAVFGLIAWRGRSGFGLAAGVGELGGE